MQWRPLPLLCYHTAMPSTRNGSSTHSRRRTPPPASPFEGAVSRSGQAAIGASHAHASVIHGRLVLFDVGLSEKRALPAPCPTTAVAACSPVALAPTSRRDRHSTGATPAAVSCLFPPRKTPAKLLEAPRPTQLAATRGGGAWERKRGSQLPGSGAPDWPPSDRSRRLGRPMKVVSEFSRTKVRRTADKYYTIRLPSHHLQEPALPPRLLRWSARKKEASWN
jgi:hypothetical protein